MADILTNPQNGQSVAEDRIHPLTWAVALVIGVLAIIPFLKNYKYNDNHLAWLNHDYCKNMMISTEENSVFMTEGGDNQVFGTLYFTYAEKLRPDLSPYDQKGNIFKRIYGDMRYIDPNTLNRRMNLVDTHLFGSEEPFYVEIRDRADPYFIPYWQGRRPVYLTWQRPEPWTLIMPNYREYSIDKNQFTDTKETYGDYYYKRYGIMYKVQEIEYSLVDYLEIKKEVSVADAQAHLSSLLHRSVDTAYTMGRLQKMQKAGYLSISGNSVRYVKSYDQPHKTDYFEKMLLRWHEAPNAMYWDTLTREIVINYDYQLGEINREEMGELQDIRSRETRPDRLADIDKRIQEKWTKAKAYYADALVYGRDSITSLHNIAAIYLRNGIEDLDAQAHGLLKQALSLYRASWGTYSLMFNYLVIDTLKHSENEAKNLKEAEFYFAQMKKEMTYYRSSKGDYTKYPVWNNFAGLENYFNLFKQVSTVQLGSMQQQLEKQLINPSTADVRLIEDVISLLYSRGTPFQYQPYITKAEELFNKAYAVKKNDKSFMAWSFSLASYLQNMDRVYAVGKDMERAYGGDVPDLTFYYSMGIASYNSGKRQEAKAYMNRFLDQVSLDRKAMVQLRAEIDNAKRLLQAIDALSAPANLPIR